MFGWEFSPFNSGGLGVACEGLSKALSSSGVDLTFVLPFKINISVPWCKFVFANESDEFIDSDKGDEPDKATSRSTDWKNLDELYDNWDKYASIVSLKVYFINPSSSLEKKWVISPYVHSKISDKSSLKAGLNALFETVEPVLQENVQS